MKKRILPWVAGAAVMAGLVWLLVLPHADDRLTAPLPQRSDEPARQVVAPRADAETLPAARLPALPGADVPMAEAAPTLQQLADAGHVEAACRLSVELLRCRQLQPYGPDPTLASPPSMSQHFAAEEKRLAAEGDLEGANQAAVLLMAYTALESDCAWRGPALDAQADQYLRQAALGGAREARIRYAAGETTGLHGNAFGHLMSPEFDDWRRDAPRLAQQAFEQGEPEALLLLLLSDPRGATSNLAMLEPPSESRDRSRLLLARRVFGDDPALERFERNAPVDEAVQRAAEAEAADWHRRYFKGATARLSDHTASLTPHFDPWCELDSANCVWPAPTANTAPDCAGRRP